jgi:hypothetical protein
LWGQVVEISGLKETTAQGQKTSPTEKLFNNRVLAKEIDRDFGRLAALLFAKTFGTFPREYSSLGL